MSEFGERVVEEAREWIGTPFAWGQSLKGVGCDCKGFIAGVARELSREEAGNLYATTTGYDGLFDPKLLREGMEATFDPGKKMMPGDVLLCSWKGRPGHLAIYSGDDRAIHTQISLKAYVKETKLSVLHHFYPLHSIWRWKRK